MKRHLTIKIFFAVFIALLFSCASTSLNNDSETEITEKIEFPKPNAPYESKKLEVIEYKVNKDNSKNAPVTAGKTYKFIVEGRSKFLIIAPTNNVDNCWNVMENDGSNVFEMQVTIPADALQVPVAFSGVRNRYENCSIKIPVKGNFMPELIVSEENCKRIIVDIPVLSSKVKLKGGDFYEICAGQNDKQFLNVGFNDGDKWVSYAIEKNERGNFQKVIQIPADAAEMVCHFDEKPHRISNGTHFVVEKNPEKYAKIIQGTEENILYIQSSYVNSKVKLETGKFYKIIAGPAATEDKYLRISTVNKNNEWKTFQSEKDKNGYFLMNAYIPKMEGTLNVAAFKTPDDWDYLIASYNLKSSSKPYKFETASDYSYLQQYKTKSADSRLINYMEEINAIEMGKTDPDAMIEKCVEQINYISDDDYQKVKFIHDMVWYLLSYDIDNYMTDTIPDQNYKSILKTNLSVCAGFANLFKQICDVAQIPCVTVSGYARGGVGDKTWKSTDDPTQTNHSWNLVRISGKWFLVDSTWNGRQTTKGEVDSFYSNVWLFAEPEEFIHTHFPSLQEFQLLDEPKSAEIFSKMEYLRPSK